MSVSVNKIKKNLRKIREKISGACKGCGRDPREISMVAVTKTENLETIKNLLDAGITEFGENRAKDLAVKSQEFDQYLVRRRKPLTRPVRWHMVGHVQRNKVKKVVEFAQVVHSVDSLRLAEELEERVRRMNGTMDVMLQVNCSDEPQKYGCAVGAASHLAELIASMPGLRLVGLMTMGPLGSGRDETRNSFARLRELFSEMQDSGIGGSDFRHLSMGMTDDYEMAVEEGATILRIGRAIFQ